VVKKYVPIFEEHAVNNDLLAEGKRNLGDYFQSKGYYDVEVDIRSVPPENDVETVEYVISRGSRYKLVHISCAGNRYFRDETLVERMYMQPASFSMRHGRYSEAFRRKDEENIATLYRSNGFHDMKVTSVVDRSYRGKKGQVAVTVHIDEGAQWLVDRVTLNGVTQFKHEELMQRLTSSPGQPFADVNLASDRNVLLTYYYARGFPEAGVKAEWEPGGSPHHVNVSYTVTEGNRKFVRAGHRPASRARAWWTRTYSKPGDPLADEQAEIQKRFYDLGMRGSRRPSRIMATPTTNTFSITSRRRTALSHRGRGFESAASVRQVRRVFHHPPEAQLQPRVLAGFQPPEPF
jgi:outer membrane protein assembly factor BamA